jgi:hypothetical protein
MVGADGLLGEGANSKRLLAKVQKNVCNVQLLTLRYPYQGNTLSLKRRDKMEAVIKFQEGQQLSSRTS